MYVNTLSALKKKNLLLLLFCLLLAGVNAQYYSAGADPFSTDWCQIKTDNYQILFPRSYEQQAQVFASKMDYAYDYVVQSMQSKPRKLSIIIHTQTANSNGFVAWAPRRMELWTTPSQDAFNYSQEWMEQLIVHESRHFVQENKMNQGFTKVLRVLLGEQAEMIPLGLMTRQWFMEGDAVATETALSHAGRGRMPSFEQGLRAVTLEKGTQGYDVAHLGTYRHYMPDHYEVGYHTVAVNRLYRDKALFDHKMDDIGRFSTLRGFRDSRKIEYYGFAIDILEKEWIKQDSLLEKTSYKPLLQKSDDYNSYAFLQEDRGQLYAVRNSMSAIPEIVEMDSDGHAQVVARTGWKAEPDFSVRQGKMVFADNLPDPRWEQRSSADLFVMDLSTKVAKRITHHQVMQAPSFNADASQIVAQWVGGNGTFFLQILDASTGALVEQLPNPENQFYFSPKWSSDGTKIVYIAQESDKKSLKYFDLKAQKEVLLVEETYGEMSHPFPFEGEVYFTASYSGINNVYVCNMATKDVRRITSARFGADYAAIWDGQLCFSNYTSDGYQPVQHVDSDGAGELLSDVKDRSLGLGDKLTLQEGGIIDFSLAPLKTYKTRSYSRFLHLFQIHSWFPMLPVTVEDGDVSREISDGLYPSLTLLSHNELSTSFLSASYNGNPAQSSEKFKINYTYEGFYPKLGLDASWGEYDRTIQVSTSSSTGYSSVPVTYNTKLFMLRPSVSLPLSYKRGVYSLYISNQLFAEYVNVNVNAFSYNENYFSRGFESHFVRAKQSAIRDLYSPFLQQVSFSLSYDDFYSKHYKIASYGRLNIPGIGAHHVLKMGLNWQRKDIKTSNALGSLPRGYSSSYNTGIAYFSTDYFLPLAYPDINLGAIFNVKRCSMGLYGDIAQIADIDAVQHLVGGGGSLFFDVNLLRYEVDVRLGLQVGVMAYSANKEIAYPINLIFKMNVF